MRLLDAQMIDEFIARAEGVDLAIGVVERESLLERLPQSKRTWLTFRGGAYTGANLFCVRIAQGARRRSSCGARSSRTGRRDGECLSMLGPALLLGALLRVRTLDESARGSRRASSACQVTAVRA